MKGEKIITGWHDWSEAYELAQQRKYETWLNTQISKGRGFAWGTVQAYYDLKSSTSVLWCAMYYPMEQAVIIDCTDSITSLC